MTGPNPDALPGAGRPRPTEVAVNGTRLYAEIRGTGPAVLLVGAADEDAEVLRPLAERLPGRTVVTYDRRGTRRSGRDGWPTGASAIHADDAAALLAALGLGSATVFGGSAGGIVALELALRHPSIVARALVFEPGYLALVPEGAALRRRGDEAVAAHLSARPGDWAGAVAALGRAAAGPGASSRGLFEPLPGREWYAARGDENAEALVREDLALTAEHPDLPALRSSSVDIRFAFGTRSVVVFRTIAEHLAAAGGRTVVALDGLGHAAYLDPGPVAAWILDPAVPSGPRP
jgi:pimeloyl-ACP methyl ester carboxylesterase